MVLAEWLLIYIKRLASLQTLDWFGFRGGTPAFLRDRVVNPEYIRESAD
jgi:hypothetical protein